MTDEAAHDDTVRVVGTHLDPQWLIGRAHPLDSVRANEIVATIAAGNGPTHVWITRGGGLFVEHPVAPDERLRPDQLDRSVRLLNLVICELAMTGIVSFPASSAEVALAEAADTAIHVTTAAGSVTARSLPSSAREGSSRGGSFPLQCDLVARDIDGTPRAAVLDGIAPSLPRFVAGAFASYARQLLPESLINAWIAIEQLVDSYWETHRGLADTGARRQRLDDSRSYSAAVRIEVLQTTGVLTSELAETLHRARQARNSLAHRGKLSSSGSDSAIDGLVELLAKTTQLPVTRPSTWVEAIPW